MIDAHVSTTVPAGSPARVLARVDGEPLDHGTGVYATEVASAPGMTAGEIGR